MIGVRKSLDFIFTKYELKALDDLMPESNRKHKEEDEEEDVTNLVLHFALSLSLLLLILICFTKDKTFLKKKTTWWGKVC